MKYRIALVLAVIIAVSGTLITCEIKEPDAILTVSFDTDGGTPVPEEVTVVRGKTLGNKFPANPVKGTDEFLGWFDGLDKYDANTVIAVDVTLVAKWKAPEGSVEIVRVIFEATDAIPEQTIVDVTAGKAVGPLFPFDPRKQGSWFDGWDLEGQEFTKDTPVTQDITVTAKWTAKTTQYTVTFNLPFVHQAANPGVNGKTFQVWEGDCIDEWEPRFYKTLESGPPPNEYQFYQFMRWTDDGTANGLIFDERTPINRNVSLTGFYLTGLYPATFDLTPNLNTAGTFVAGQSSSTLTPADQYYDASRGEWRIAVNAIPAFAWIRTTQELRDHMVYWDMDTTKIRFEVEVASYFPSERINANYLLYLGWLHDANNWNGTNAIEEPATIRDHFEKLDTMGEMLETEIGISGEFWRQTNGNQGTPGNSAHNRNHQYFMIRMRDSGDILHTDPFTELAIRSVKVHVLR